MSVADLYRDDPMLQCRHIWRFKIKKYPRSPWVCKKCKTKKPELDYSDKKKIDYRDGDTIRKMR